MLKNRKKKGFTLIELIVVIAILGILAAVLIPRFGGFTEKARKTQALTDAKQIATAIDSFYAENDSWPTSDDLDEILTTAFGSTTEAKNHGDWDTNKDPATLDDGGFVWKTTEGYTAGRDATGAVEYK